MLVFFHSGDFESYASGRWFFFNSSIYYAVYEHSPRKTVYIGLEVCSIHSNYCSDSVSARDNCVRFLFTDTYMYRYDYEVKLR